MAMAEQIEERVTRAKALGSQSGEAKLLVMAALFMADELHDMEIELKRGTARASTVAAAERASQERMKQARCPRGGDRERPSSRPSRLLKKGMGRLSDAFPRTIRSNLAPMQRHRGFGSAFRARKISRSSSTTPFSAAC